MNLSTAMGWLARGLAIAGGLVLVVLTLLTVTSITGRAIGSIAFTDPPEYLRWLREGAAWLVAQELSVGNWRLRISSVPGDVELVQHGMGFAIFSFLPWCQYVRGHATVDIFTNFLSPAVNRIIDLISELLMTIVITIIAWRLWFGMLDKIRYRETTFILQFPVWWPYAAAMVAAAIGVLVSYYVLYERIRAVTAGEPGVQTGQGGRP